MRLEQITGTAAERISCGTVRLRTDIPPGAL